MCTAFDSKASLLPNAPCGPERTFVPVDDDFLAPMAAELEVDGDAECQAAEDSAAIAIDANKNELVPMATTMWEGWTVSYRKRAGEHGAEGQAQGSQAVQGHAPAGEALARTGGQGGRQW